MNRSTKVLGAILALLLAVPLLHASANEQVRKRAREWNATAAADTDILSADIGVSVPNKSSAFRVTVALVSTSSVFNVVMTRTDSAGATTSNTFGLNGSTALTAGDLYTFTIGMEDKIADDDAASFSLNFQCETATTAGYLSVQEVINQ